MTAEPPDPAPRITLIGKPGCHLCDEAREVVRRVSARTGAGWHELSILDEAALADEHAEQIPVVLVDGAMHDFFRVDEARLTAALDRSGARSSRWFGGRRR